jgi:hypothetical protein
MGMRDGFNAKERFTLAPRFKIIDQRNSLLSRVCGKGPATRVSPVSRKPGTCPCGGAEEDILVPFVSHGDPKDGLPTASQIRDFVLEQLNKVEL